MRHLVGPANCQQHMAGIERARRARGAGRRADTLRVQKQKQTLALNALEAEVHIAGKTGRSCAVERAMGNLAEAFNEPVAQRRDLFRIFVQMVARIFERSRHANNTGDVFRARALAALLRAALNDVG